MSKKERRKKHKGSPTRLRKALSSAVLASAILVPATQTPANEKPQDLTINQRITVIREAINNRLAQNTNLDEILSQMSYEESEIAQWVNWGNWGNWANWGNWVNFANWGNWGNWYNWGNF